MYERFYHLRERPFSLSPDPDYLYPSRVHTEALSYLRYGIEGHAGFIVITGEIGSGKTTLLQTALRGLNKHTSVSRLVSTMLDARDLLEAVMLDFGLTPDIGASKPRLLRDLARFLVEQRVAGRLALLVIDEAQNLSLAALEEVRMLSNLETEQSKLIQIVLVGQPGLRALLASRELEQLRQRVTVSYHLPALDMEETAAYIHHRLSRAADGAPLVFPRDVTELIHRHSQGVPRTINVIADAVLLYGYGEGQEAVDVALTRSAIDELQTAGLMSPPAPATAPAADASLGTAELPADLLAREERLVAAQHRIVLEQSRLLRLRREMQTINAAQDPALYPDLEPPAATRDQAVPGRATSPAASVADAALPGAAAPGEVPARQPGDAPDATAGQVAPEPNTGARPVPGSPQAPRPEGPTLDPEPPWPTAPAPPRPASAAPGRPADKPWPGPSASRRLLVPSASGLSRTKVWARLGRGFFRTATPALED